MPPATRPRDNTERRQIFPPIGSAPATPTLPARTAGERTTDRARLPGLGQPAWWAPRHRVRSLVRRQYSPGVGVHEVAAAGFDDPQDYEAARPSYPPDAVAWLREHLRLD